MLDAVSVADELFFSNTDLDKEQCCRVVAEALNQAEDGELFLEQCQSESIHLEDSCIRSSSFDSVQGFGLRAVSGEATGYAHSNELSITSLKRAGKVVKAVCDSNKNSVVRVGPPVCGSQSFYASMNPLALTSLDEKIKVLSEIDSYIRNCDPRVKQVIATLAGSWQVICILRPDGQVIADIRPLVLLSISVVVADGNRVENGSCGSSARSVYGVLTAPDLLHSTANKALNQALVALGSVPAPAGEIPVVLGPGWPGVLLHEAVGHGLEGDFNRKKTSAFSALLGQRVAAPNVTVVDDGTLQNCRGSLSVDDEGTSTHRTALIENGVLVGYMHDRLNAKLMGLQPTGNGRRQSYCHAPLPRMTNTFMLAGHMEPKEIISSVKRGLYAVHFRGGQVDITSGKFVFSASEAYLIEDGKISAPVRGATLIGNGPDILTKVSLVGSDLELDNGIGSCGKNGQTIPVGVGQPTLLVDSITVGGTGTKL